MIRLRVDTGTKTIAALAIWLMSAVDAGAKEDAESAARLDALTNAFMASEQVPDAIAAVVFKDTTIPRGYGLSDLEHG